MTHYIDAMILKHKHRMWTWRQCVHLARQERREAPPINWNGVIYGLCVTVGSLLAFWMLISRPGCV